MREKQRIDYIYFVKSLSKRGRVRFLTKQEAGVTVLQVETTPDLKERTIKKLRRGFKKYQINQVVAGADKEMAKVLELEEMLFRGRKQELIENRRLLFQNMKTMRKTDKRSSVLFVLKSRKWSRRDILPLLVAAKDYFEDLYIALEEDFIGISQLEESLYEEWGVVLHIFENGEIPEEKQDFVLFLLEEWDKKMIMQYRFCNAYLVLEVEGEEFRRDHMEHLGKEKKADEGKERLYAGFVYEKGEKRLPYQMAVNIFCQNPVLYQDFNISIVAIYGVE
ncbi:MAG: hypothetical protein K2J90_03275 [Lachnospiraceae bacterium]|nr:hypothetical protein [Lachnospiraceae bacterium]